MEIKRGPANLQRGGERTRGTLAIQGRRLRFEPDRSHTPSDPEVIEISDIKRIRRSWTKLVGLVPVVPNVVELEMRNQERHRFTVGGRKAWIAAIEGAHADTPRG